MSLIPLAALAVGYLTFLSAPSGAGAQRTERIEIHALPGLRFGLRGQSPPPLLRVRAGREVRLVLVNRDQVGHDLWVVGVNERPPYLSPAFPGARTPVVEPGGRFEVRFVPKTAGRYRYVCTVPGHEAVMHGYLLVEAAP